MNPHEKLTALAAITKAICDVIASEPQGVPGGTLYAAMMGHGASLEIFEQFMAALVAAGRITKRGQLYFIVDPK